MLASKRVSRLQKRAAAVVEARAEVSTRAAAYIRVSTDEQAQTGNGMEAQESKVRAFATSQGYDLVAVFRDPGVSGVTVPASRPGFGALVAMAEAKGFAVVLVARFDRLARNIVYAVTAVNDLSERHGVGVRSVSEPIDTGTAIGRMMFAVLAGMAEQERSIIIERTHGGRREKAAKGGFAGGAAPLGYVSDTPAVAAPAVQASGATFYTYGWVAIEGDDIGVNVATGAAAGAPLYTTATAGVLGTTAAGQTLIPGVSTNAANGTGAAAVTSCAVSRARLVN